MTLALGLAATFVGATAAIAGVTGRPLSRLLFGYWDAPNSSGSAPAATAPGTAPGTAATGGAHATSGAATQHAAGAYPTGGPSR